METNRHNRNVSPGQLISVPHRDTIRLLEVYVKRSLSLNDGTLGLKKVRGNEKFVTIPARLRRHSSDPSLLLTEGLNNGDVGPFSPSESPANQPETPFKESKKPTKKAKNKKLTVWRRLFGIFYRKSGEEEEEDSPSETPELSKARESTDTWTTGLPTSAATSQKRKSKKRKSTKRRFSKKRLSKQSKPAKDLNPADITRVENIVSVQPTDSYYEKMSEELEKIVHEVQEKEEDVKLSDDEINRIIALTKEQGDAIDVKLKDNPTLNKFFQQMTYSSFQKMADAYLNQEASPVHNPPTVPNTAPELIKLAFTYDFTAKIARLSKQNVGHITGLGNRYLQERFEYKQACTDHRMSLTDG